ncbi:Protein bric-a-brac 2 [Gryllus bimaculatus]|nr:Protein bric-a-brac 2 [Gryllus bimaculatus]
MGSDQQFCLQWHNYQSSLLASLPQLLDSDDLTDVTLSAGGRNIKAHRVILSACSQYFKDLFKVLPPMQHPVIVLPGTNFTDLCALVTFMYSGEVNIYQEQLQGILTMADAMQIRGLAEVNGAAQNDIQAKKDGHGSAKRPRLSTHQNLMFPVVNPVVIETSTKRPLLAESVDMSGNLMANSNFEIYGESRSSSNIQKNSQEELHFESGNKSDSAKLKSASENLDIYMNASRNDKGRKSALLPESDVMHYVEDTAYSSPNPPPMGSPGTSEDTRIKLEPEHHDFGVCGGESSISRQALTGSTGEGQKLPGLDCENGQDQQSPCSDDSVGSNFGAESKLDRMQVGQGVHLSSQKFSAPYNKLSTTTHSSKLFATCIVCGKQLSNQYNLRVHMETHQNVNYACRVCNHVSRSRDALRKHVSYRHPKENKDRLSVGGIAREGSLLSASNNGVSGTNRKPKLFTTNSDIKQ